MKFRIQKFTSKISSLSIALILISAIAVGGTTAYMLAKTGSKTNTFTKGDANIEVSEPGDGNYTLDRNNRIAKEVYVTNDNKTTPNAIPVYVRVRLVPIVRDADGNGTGESVQVEYPDLNTANWEQHGDYYYYKGVLQPGETTKALIKTAWIKDGIPAGKTVEIQVIADSIQTVGGVSKEAWGLLYGNGTWHS
ncbi:MAG: hypothetical protein GX485_00475 [Clostridiales bacterium]|jgi:hypothetical protein|nr:hypothetical protein [Clostridiales bacterium]